MKLGIAICTFNRVETLKETVARVQAHTRSEHDLIVVDDGSSDGTRSEMTKLGVDVLSTKNRGIAWNKNRALYYLKTFAGSDAIILLEDDTFPFEDGWETAWVEAIARWGHVNLAAEHWGKGFFRDGDGTAERPYKSVHVSAQCAGFSSAALEAVGYMDSRFRGWGMEHVEHTSRFLKAGYGGEPVNDLGIPLYYVIASPLDVLFREESAGLDDSRKNALIARNMEVCNRIGGDKIRRDPWINDEEMAIFLSEFNAHSADKLFLHLRNDENQPMAYDAGQRRIRFVASDSIAPGTALQRVVCFYDGFKLRMAVVADGKVAFLPASLFHQGQEDLSFDVVLDEKSGLYLKADDLYFSCDKARGHVGTLDRSQPGDWERLYLGHIERMPRKF